MGGKFRLAKHFAPILVEALAKHDGRFVEPFVGGFNLLPALGDAVSSAKCYDIHSGLIVMYKAIQDGSFIPPENVSEDEYRKLKDAKDWSNPLTAFAAFGCAYGGREFEGYARGAKGRNYAKGSRNTVMRKKKFMKNVNFQQRDYIDICIEKSSVVYCDPPYLGVKGYSSGKFDHGRFYQWCEHMVADGHTVFVSEHNKPRSAWKVVWEKNRTINICAYRRVAMVELLFEVTR